MASDSSEVDAALVAHLASDATLAGLLGGPHVYFDLAPQGLTAFVLVRLVSHAEEAMMPGATAYEVFTYLVKVVIQTSSGDVVKAAAARINDLLHYGAMPITGYALMVVNRRERVRFAELDDVNRAWMHRGGVYDVWAAPTDA
jgi:hypothetical protein